jgi:hypothetical protein
MDEISDSAFGPSIRCHSQDEETAKGENQHKNIYEEREEGR